jgi:oxygen-dependent protoporphyrinogen oxidase
MRIAVVGAGISGLTCAFRLQQQGHCVRVFEAEPEVGGRMGTTHVDGFPIDTGVNLLLANYERLHALSEELGIADQLFDFHSGAGGILRDHELNSFTPSNVFEILGYRGVSFVSRMRLIRYFISAFRFSSALDFFDLSVGDDPDTDRDAYTAASEQLGEEVAAYIVDPFVRTFHFHGARQMSMKYFDALVALFLRKDNFKPQGFKGFMQTLPQALAEQLDVQTASPVSLVRPSPAKVEGGVEAGVEVDGERFDAVVLAVPAPIALASLAPPSADQLEVLSQTTYAPTLSVAFRCPLSVAEDFEGIWIPYHESALISECSNETCKGASNDTECVINFGLHTEAAAAWLERPDEEVFETVAVEWSRLFPHYREALEGLHVKRWPLAMPIYGPGHVERVRRFWGRGQGDGRVYLCGDYLNHPWVEGSIRCGEKVAAMIDSTY